MLQSLTAGVGIALFAVYSVVMMATAGTAAWAWIILAAAVMLTVTAARRSFIDKGEGQDG